jgi:hypothetical protein
MYAVSALTLPSAAMTLGYNVGPVETGSHQELRVTVIDARGHAGPDDLRRILIHDLPHNFASLRYGSLARPAKLLRRKRRSTARRYAYLDADPMRCALRAS